MVNQWTWVYTECNNFIAVAVWKENLFVAMPSYKTKKVDENNKPIYADVCYPITKEFCEKLYTELITECEKQLEKAQEINPQTGRPYNRREQIQREAQEQEKAEQDKATKQTKNIKSLDKYCIKQCICTQISNGVLK